MTTQPVDIFVFGRTFRVNCPAEQKEALELAAMDLDNRLTELKNRTRVTNVEQLVFIAALNVCHELAQERNKTAEFAHNMEERIRLLQHTIEQALLEHTSIDLHQNNSERPQNDYQIEPSEMNHTQLTINNPISSQSSLTPDSDMNSDNS